MEVSSCVFRQQKSGGFGFGWLGARRAMRRVEFSDKSHIKYYNNTFNTSNTSNLNILMCCSTSIIGNNNTTATATDQKKKTQKKINKKIKKQLKALKSLCSTDDHEMSTEIRELVNRLELMRHEEKKRNKMMRKHHKNNKIIMMNNNNDIIINSSSSSDSSDTDSNTMRIIKQQPQQQQEQQVIKEEEEIIKVVEEDDDDDLMRVMVCMGNKCKKMGAEALMAEFQNQVAQPSQVVPCKCMGKCKTAPNVTITTPDDHDAAYNPLFIGVALHDVSSILNSSLTLTQPALPN